VLRRIFGPKRNEVTGGRRKLHNEQAAAWFVLFAKYNRIIRSRRMWWMGACGINGGEEERV
jgi:hypothetical protein